MVEKYMKRPVTVEALKFEYSQKGIAELKEFCQGNIGRVSKARSPWAVGEAEICTLEDGTNLVVKHIATEGDYIIKGIQGEFYACKPDIFHQTYVLTSENNPV